MSSSLGESLTSEGVSSLQKGLSHCMAMLSSVAERATSHNRKAMCGDEGGLDDDDLLLPSPSAIVTAQAAVRLERSLEAFMGALLKSHPHAFGSSGAAVGGSAQHNPSRPASLPLVPSSANSSAAPVLEGKQQIATYIIDKTFDGHKAMLRQHLAEARAEIARLRGVGGEGHALAEAEGTAEALRASLAESGQQREDLCAALEHSQAMRREALLTLHGSRRSFLGWHQQIIMRLIGTFSLCEEWRDWQLEAFISARPPVPMPPPSRTAPSPVPAPPPGVGAGTKGGRAKGGGARPERVSPPPTPPPVTPVKKDSLPSIHGPSAHNRRAPHRGTGPPGDGLMNGVALPYGEGPSSVTKAIIHPRGGGGGGRGGPPPPTAAGTAPTIVARLAKQ